MAAASGAPGGSAAQGASGSILPDLSASNLPGGAQAGGAAADEEMEEALLSEELPESSAPEGAFQRPVFDDSGAITHYWVKHRGVDIKVPASKLDDQEVMDALLEAHAAGAKARDRTARVRADRNEQVRGTVGAKRSLKGTAKVGEPDKFSGRKGDGKFASATLSMECQAFIDSMKDYLDLNDVPEEGRAALAASYLTGAAKTTYGAYKAAAVIAGKKVDWAFFESTLRAAYVPRAQVADDLQKYFAHGFLKKAVQTAKDTKDLRVDELLAAHKVALQEAVRHGFAQEINDLVQCQLFLAALPDCLRAVVKLNEANEAHISWLHLERQMQQREQQLQLAWHTWLESEDKPVKRARHDPPADDPPKKPFKFGKGSGAGGASGSGSQPSTSTAAAEGKGPKPGDKCNACGQLGHWANSCPNKKNKKHQGKSK
jgi:hypothetical protein